MLAVTLRENALTTLDALKTSLGIDPEEEDAQRDATLVQLINAASAWLETQLGRKLGKSTYRQRYCGTGTQQLSLEQYPIVSVERITDKFTGETITDFDFNETGEIGVLFREDGWTYRGHIGGWPMTTLPPENIWRCSMWPGIFCRKMPPKTIRPRSRQIWKPLFGT